MKKICVLILFLLLMTPAIWADTQDTVVFKGAMSPDNEVPVIAAPGNSGFATITVRVTRDGTGNITAATVVFDIDYSIPVTGTTTFTGLHIHNALPGTSGGVVINTGLSGTNTITASGTGHINKVVNYTSTDVDGLKYVTGLLEMPENYYVNIHSTAQPGGLMRAPMLRTSWTFRPQMTPLQEVTPITDLDAEGAATIQVLVNRNVAGVITSGSVIFDVDYRIPANSVITGLHIHNAAAGANGAVVIDSGIIGGTKPITTTTGRGNIYRIADIDSNNTTGLAALTGIMNDPTQYYVNIHTTTYSAGLMRGQLSRDSYAFFGLMTNAEENPPTATTATANTMTLVKVVRDTTGNIVSGTVSFNVAYSGFDPNTTFTGLHIHNGPIGVNAGVVINTGLSGSNTVVTATGSGSVNRDVSVDANGATALTAMKGLLQNPEQYYVNIHTTVNSGGAIRSQLGRETYHYRTAMLPSNEVPAVSNSTTATGWVTAKISRDANGVINGGQVIFDVDVNGTGSSTTYTGLHIHSGSAAVAGGVVINTGLSGTNSVTAATGTVNVTRVVDIAATDTAGLAMLNTLFTAPDQAYVNIHTTTNSGGVARSQMLPVLNYVPQVAGGAEWITSVTIGNPSTTTSVTGIVDTLASNGSAITNAVVDPNVSFVIPPGGSTTINLHNKGNIAVGFMRIYSSATITINPSYEFPAFPLSAAANIGTGRSISVPVSVDTTTGKNTGIAILPLTSGQLNLTLRDNAIGAVIPGGSRLIDVTAGQHMAIFVNMLVPDVSLAQYNGRLVIDATATTGTAQIVVLALQFDGTTMTAVPLQILP